MSKERFKPQMHTKDKPAQAEKLPKSVRKQLLVLGVRSLSEAQGMIVFEGR